MVMIRGIFLKGGLGAQLKGKYVSSGVQLGKSKDQMENIQKALYTQGELERKNLFHTIASLRKEIDLHRRSDRSTEGWSWINFPSKCLYFYVFLEHVRQRTFF